MQNSESNIDWNGVCWQERKFSHPKKVIRLGTSFSGIGAIEHAFQRLCLNTQLMFAGDIEPDCKTAYFANYNLPAENWHDDIHTFDATRFKDQIDLFVGGAPCQAFSLRGKRGGFEDTRGTLFREFARVIMECQPKVFIFENVRGMLSHDKGCTWNTIRETFEHDCGYDIHFQVLDGKDYGIPQSRERLYCIGFKEKQDFLFPKPIPLKTKAYDFLETKVDKKYYLGEKGFQFITKTINRRKKYTQINGDVILCQKRNQQFNWHGDFIFNPIMQDAGELKNKVFPVDSGEEKYFVNNSVGKYAIDVIGGISTLNPKEIDPDDVKFGLFRKLTPRECLRFMGFDDSFKIAVSDSATYKQSGNSIIVNVLIALLKQMDITCF